MRGKIMWRDKLEVVFGAGLSVGLTACGGQNAPRGDSAWGGIASGGSTSDADTDAVGSGPTEGTSGAEAQTEPGGASGIKFDVGVPDVEPPEQDEGCTKVDFLFVIDNSGSMGDDQANLVANFPNFIDGIQATLTQVDEYQVGVVTTDAYDYNLAGCDVLGGLVVQTGGDDASGLQCGPYAEGYNFMTQLDNLPQTFACAAKVGTDGSGAERPMEALEVAVRGDLGAAGQCNEKFLRDDALLVIVVITDEADGPGDPSNDPSPGTPQSWHDTVVDAKAGIAENVVVVSLVHELGGPCPPEHPGNDGANIADFTRLFDNGFVGGICGDYGQIFEQATGIIEGACNDFTPPG